MKGSEMNAGCDNLSHVFQLSVLTGGAGNYTAPQFSLHASDLRQINTSCVHVGLNECSLC
jgi:hypothetical protein